jgi:putative Mn2+ efflux pump MntP
VVDRWLAFTLLGMLGGRMLLKALRSNDPEAAPERHSLGALILTAVATSLDALVAGITLAVIQTDILVAASAIGLVSFLLASAGTMAGRWVGPAFGRTAEGAGGLCLIAIGGKVLIEHIMAA